MRSVGKQWQSRWFFVPLLLVVLSGVLTFVLLQVYYPAYAAQPTTVLALAVPGESPELAWPAYGQSAIATEHQGVVATHGEQAPRPTASTAKVITLLAVLEKKPLKQGEQGPTLTMNAADVELHARYVARNSTNTAVYAGMKLTQYQAMQSILLASSGNMSDTLAIWAFGSLDAYYAHANDMVKRFGATQTTIGGDASGLSPHTMSTATDMALLTLQAMKQPAIAEIAAQKTAQVPYAGTIRSSNRLLGKPGVVGLKTGETVEAGGNFLLALRHTDAGHSQYVAVVVYGAELASIATADSYALYESAAPFVKYQEVVPKSGIVAQYQVPRAEPAQAITGRSVHAWTWAGLPVEPRVSAEVITQATKHCSTVGSLSYGNDTTPLVLVRDTKTSC